MFNQSPMFKQENLMKLLTACKLLIDCGKASKRTRGTIWGVFTEAGPPPANHWS
jgi:hypothetical protein